jgi:hypothetical protein
MTRHLKVTGIRRGGGWAAVIILLLAAGSATAATNTAASASFADVSAAINSSTVGDTVLIPPGTSHWTTPLDFRGISLIGSGTNQTVIYDDMDRNVNQYPPLIFIHGGGTNTLQIGNFQLVGGSNTRNWHGEIATDSSGPIRIHDIYFNLCIDKALMLYGANLSLVDHCYFRLKYAGILIRDVGYGDVSWATPPNYGTALMPVVEDCVFTNIDHSSSSDNAVDAEWGGRCTFRHNLCQYVFFEAHGTESGGRNRGGRVFEVYSNTFVQDPAISFPVAVNLRAGSGVFYGNTATGYSYFANINANRSTEAFLPWGRGDGSSPWDDNAGTNYLSGTHTGANGANYLEVAGANWAVNQWVGYTVVNREWTNNLDMGGWWLTNGCANFNYSVILSNNANRMFYHVSKDFGWMRFTNGNRFVINKCNQILDQPGLGSGDLVLGDIQPWGPDPTNTVFKTAVWPREPVEGVYSWNNTLNGADAGFGSDYPHVKPNVHYFNATPKPGYTPLVYPHPLQSGNTSGGNTNAALLPPARVWVQQ